MLQFFTQRASEPQLQSQVASYLLIADTPINLKPKPVTPALLEVFEKVPITYDFSIFEAPNQINHKTKDYLIS